MKKILLTGGFSVMVVLGANAQLTNYAQIHISEGAVLATQMEVLNHGNITNKGVMELRSSLENNAAFSSAGTLIFSGEEGIQEVSGQNVTEVDRLILRNDVLLNTTLKVKDELEFEAGSIYTRVGARLELEEGAGYRGAGNISHVAGEMAKTGNGAFTFPLGDGFSMRSFDMEDLGGNTVVASYVAESPMGLSMSMDHALESISDREYWYVRSETREGGDVKLKKESLAYLRSDVWTPSPRTVTLNKEGFRFTSGNSREIVKGIGVWPNPTEGVFSLGLTGMNDNDDIRVDILHQNGSVVRHLEGKVKDLRKAYTLPGNLATTSLKIRVVNNGEVLTQTLVLNK